MLSNKGSTAENKVASGSRVHEFDPLKGSGPANENKAVMQWKKKLRSDPEVIHPSAVIIPAFERRLQRCRDSAKAAEATAVSAESAIIETLVKLLKIKE